MHCLHVPQAVLSTNLKFPHLDPGDRHHCTPDHLYIPATGSWPTCIFTYHGFLTLYNIINPSQNMIFNYTAGTQVSITSNLYLNLIAATCNLTIPDSDNRCNERQYDLALSQWGKFQDNRFVEISHYPRCSFNTTIHILGLTTPA